MSPTQPAGGFQRVVKPAASMITLCTMSAGLSTSNLPRTDVFQRLRSDAPLEERLAISYQRARAIAAQYALSLDDVLNLTPKFWDLHMDNIVTLDSAAATLLAIQYNLAAGTLAPFAKARPELRPLMDDILKFDVSAEYLLTELAHGLDAPNIETIATLLPSGEFDLHTPNDGARKFMPPTGPFGSTPRVAIVFARLMVNCGDRGIRPFIVALGNGKEMCKGVSSTLLPQRGGVESIDHSVTTFNHVRLPGAALLGSLERPQNHRAHFASCIWRINVGTLALALFSIPALSVISYNAARYSLRRTVTRYDGVRVPIMSFRTQQLPILLALAQTAVMKAYAQFAIQIYRDSSVDMRARSGVAVAAKATMTQHMWSSAAEMSERMGAHGLFDYTLFIPAELAIRGIRIAEGDVLVLSIRLATELLLGRYELPKPKYPECLLARHEDGLFTECLALLDRFNWNHRDERLSEFLLPQCSPLIQAIGHRMAYEAALDAHVDQPLIDLYESGVIALDPAWYAENAGLSRLHQIERKSNAATAAMPNLEKYLGDTAARDYATSPILGAESWEAFLKGLPAFSGNAEVPLFARARL